MPPYKIINIDEKWLIEKYVSEKLSQRAIAELAGVSTGAIGDRLRKLGLSRPTRTD